MFPLHRMFLTWEQEHWRDQNVKKTNREKMRQTETRRDKKTHNTT